VADVEFREGQYVIKGTDRKVSMEEVIRKHAGGATHPLDSMGEVPTIRTFPSGAHIAEVEIDPATGMVRLDRYTAVDDAGKVINHTLVEGQIHGGMAQGIGQVFGEHAMYDEATGQLLAGSFMDYYMPRAGMLGEVRVLDHSMPSPSNPLGVKGVGEAGTTGSLPAVMNAVVDALRALGINHFDMPATPARLWQAIHDAGARQRAA
jgi:carbon-monoxide dehydrogenase large subunit